MFACMEHLRRCSQAPNLPAPLLSPLPAPTLVLLGSTWVDHTKSKPIDNKLTNYLLTGTLDGKPGEDGERAVLLHA